MAKRPRGAGTTAVHAGESVDPETGAVVGPIYQTSTFTYPLTPGKNGSWTRAKWFYTRYANPTVAAAEAKVAALERTEASLAFSSGMGAMAACVFSLAGTSQRVAAMSHIYGGTTSLLDHQAPHLGIGVDWCDRLDAGEIADRVQESTRLVVTELPTNPFNRLLDLDDLSRRLSKRWGRSRPTLLTDATFATPINLRPIDHGADLSLHSATKYLNGHTDIVGGVVSGHRRVVERLEPWRKNVGASMDPHQAFLLVRGLKTLELRVRRSEKNANILAETLEAHAKVEKVWHLSLRSHPDYRLGRRLLKGSGAIVTFQLGRKRVTDARRFMHALRLFTCAPSLGGVESLVSLPVETSHALATATQRRAQGITNGTVRLAVGVENGPDLVDDVVRALRAV